MTRTTLSFTLFVTISACDGEPEPMPPAPPEMLEVAAVEGGAHLTWVDASDDEDEFFVERSGEGSDFERIATVEFDIAQYHDGEATTGTWTYRVLASNASGSAASEAVSVTIP